MTLNVLVIGKRLSLCTRLGAFQRPLKVGEPTGKNQRIEQPDARSKKRIGQIGTDLRKGVIEQRIGQTGVELGMGDIRQWEGSQWMRY
uniref:Uncharacterized protein n=1 Tax=Amphimedon queenslandica TaxID=400682 RepID=A0A1X7UMD8_AMPQE